MSAGRTYAPERREYRDPLTDRRVRQLTDSPAEDDQPCHPHPSFTPEGRQVIFTSNRTGTSNVYLTDWD